MKKLFLTLLTAVSFTSFGQYIPTEGTFSKTYSQIRTWERLDSTWVYTDGTLKDWTFHYNVDFIGNLNGKELFGTVMENDKGQPRFFYNYLGDLYEGKDDYGEYGAYKVDILSKEDDGSWKWWNAGELRHYGSWTILYLGTPAFLQFNYFNIKE